MKTPKRVTPKELVSSNAWLTHAAHAGHGKKTKSGMGGECIVTLTGWTHPLHTNTKRKCVSILCVAEHSITNFNGDGVSTHQLKNVM